MDIKRFRVRVFVPTVYEIAAETAQEAEREATEIFKAENNTWIEPDVQLVEIP